MHIELNFQSTDEPSTDIAFSVLADESRRLAVEELFGRAGPISLADLAAAVADRHPDEPAGRSETEIATALHHSHLPKLDDADLVDYDPRSKTVTAVRTGPLRKYFSVEN